MKLYFNRHKVKKADKIRFLDFDVLLLLCQMLNNYNYETKLCRSR